MHYRFQQKNTEEKGRISLTCCSKTVIILGRSLLSESYQLESVLNTDYVHFNIFGGRDPGLANQDCLKTSFIEDNTETTSCHIRTEEENPGTYPGFKIYVRKVMSGVKEFDWGWSRKYPRLDCLSQDQAGETTKGNWISWPTDCTNDGSWCNRESNFGSMRVKSISTWNNFFNLLAFALQGIQEFGWAYAINTIAIAVIDKSARCFGWLENWELRPRKLKPKSCSPLFYV